MSRVGGWSTSLLVAGVLLAGCGDSSATSIDRAPEAAGTEPSTQLEEQAAPREPAEPAPAEQLAVWVHDSSQLQLLALDPDTGEVLSSRSTELPGDAREGEYRMEVLDEHVALVHNDAGAVQLFPKVPSGAPILIDDVPDAIDVLEVGDELWVAATGADEIRVYDDNQNLARTIPVIQPNRMELVGDDVWVMSKRTSDIFVFGTDQSERPGIAGSQMAQFAPGSVEGQYFGNAFAEVNGYALVPAFTDDVVVTIDASVAEPVGRVQVGDGPGDIVVVGGLAWVALYSEGQVIALDPQTWEERQRVAIADPEGLATDGTNLFVGTSSGEVSKLKDGKVVWASQPAAKVTTLEVG